MKIAMYLEKALIDSLSVQHDRITQPGYLGSLIRELKRKHVNTIQLSGYDPEFLVFSINGMSLSVTNDFNQLDLF